jgi:hypothetical protein
MRFNDPVNHEMWARRLATRRSLDNFRAYGAEVGLSRLNQEWSHFIFSRDPSELAFTKKRIEELANDRYDFELRSGLKLEDWEDPNRKISPRERLHWINGFIETYTEDLDNRVSSIIPPEIEDKLELFCDIVQAIQQDAERGYDSSEFGVSLGARKENPEEKIHPKKDRIIKDARAKGLREAKLAWEWQTHGNTSISRPTFIHPPFDWELHLNEEALYEDVFNKAFMGYLSEQIRKIAPPKAWKNAFLICALFDEMQTQKYEGRSTNQYPGWNYLRQLREGTVRLTERRAKADAQAKAKRDERYRAQAIARAEAYRAQASPTSMGSASLGAFISRSVQMTHGARKAIEETGDNPEKFLDRHFSEDFGESPPEDLEINRQGAKTGGMVMSIYSLSDGRTIWVITDDGHEVTTILLPSEY